MYNLCIRIKKYKINIGYSSASSNGESAELQKRMTMKNKTNITGKTLIELGFRSGKWFPEAIDHINTNQLQADAMLTYLEQFKAPPVIDLHAVVVNL